MNILFVSSEIFPFSKTGGLADVVGSLPPALQREGCNPIAIAPFYKETRKRTSATDTGKRVNVTLTDHQVQAAILKSEDHAFPVYFIDQPSYFNRDSLYGDTNGDFPDNAERFIFFSKAALEATVALDLQLDVIHCHDWQTGLIPAYLKTVYESHPAFQKTASVFTIHNLAYQGSFDSSLYPITGLGDHLFCPEGLEFFGQLSFLKAGLVYSDFVTTVSRTYRDEILRKEKGCGMDGVLLGRTDSLEGIANGINYEKWNPETDGKIAAGFSAKDPDGKAKCRLQLLDHFGIKVSGTTPVLAMVTRLAAQKGVELLMEAMDSMMSRDIAFVLLGSGERKYEDFFQALSQKYPGKVGVHLGFTEDLAHQIYAGADLFLMPSKFEPCGISQLIAMRYGTVPLVRAVGGLNDTVSGFDSKLDKGRGFRFKGFSSEDMMNALDLALAEYRRRRPWRKLVKRLMEEDFSWGPPAKEYLETYRKALREKAF